MADDGLIAAYLRELRFSVARLVDADEIVAEAEDHLLEAVHLLTEAGRDRCDAESEAIARFGSAALVARICIIDAKQGVSVPTIRTRRAGLAAILAPVLLVLGQGGNVFTDHDTVVHGVAVAMLTVSFPAFAVGLWGLRARHGGLGRLGRAALVLVLIAPPISLFAGWGALFVFIPMLAVAQLVFAVELLRSSVLPVTPLAFFAAGAIAALGQVLVAGTFTAAGADAGHATYLIALPIGLTAAGFAWLGYNLWREPEAERGRLQRLDAG